MENEEKTDISTLDLRLNTLESSENEIDMEQYSKNAEYETTSFYLSIFSPNIALSLLSITFVIERNGLVPSSLILLYGFLSHIVIWQKITKLLHSHQKKTIKELLCQHSIFPFEDCYIIFSIFYYLLFLIFLYQIFKDILFLPFHFISDKFNILLLYDYKSFISSILFIFSNFFFSHFSKSIQFSILTIFSILSIISVCYLTGRVLYTNYTNQYGSNKSLQIDTFNSNLFTSFCFAHFSLNSQTFSINGYSNNRLFSEFFSTFFKFLILIFSGFSMYVTYGRYINSTLFFSFSENDITSNFGRMSYLVTSVSTSVVCINHLKCLIKENFENRLFNFLFTKHENAASILFSFFAIFVSFFVETSLPFVAVCGAISFWLFEFAFSALFPLFANSEGLAKCQIISGILLTALALMMFVITVFCAVRDMVVYYYY